MINLEKSFPNSLIDKYGIMGNPINHSWSPQIHQLFAKQTEQQLIYQPILVPLDHFSQALDTFQHEGGKGLNITLPFKQQACQYVNVLSDRAKLAKAVNTIRFNPDGSRFGDNTDGVGFINDVIDYHQFSIANKRILILGAGGAVRGILAPVLQQLPDLLVIANRTVENAKSLAAEFSACAVNGSSRIVQACSFSELTGSKFDLVINGTSASLEDNAIDLPNNILSENAYCYDMVYGKGETPFMAWAKKNNASKVSDGLGMLVLQAAESFYIWRQVMPNSQIILNYFVSRH